MIGPRSRSHAPGQVGIEGEGSSTWKTNLSAMGVAADQYVKASVGGMPIDLRGVRNQHCELVVRNSCGCLFDVVDLVEMRVVDTGNMNALAVPLDHDPFIEQHADAHGLQTRNHDDRIMVAEHAVHRCLEGVAELSHWLKRGFDRAKCLSSKVTG